MSDFEDFDTQTGTVSIEDFSPIALDQGSWVNSRSIKMMAANVTALENATDDPEASFRNNISALEGREEVLDINSPVKNLINRETSLAQNALFNILSDNNFTDEQKQQAVGGYLDQLNDLTNPRDLVAKVSLSKSSDGETSENEYVRLNFAGNIKKVNDYKKSIQGLINSISTTDDAENSSWKAFGQFTETIIPFMEPVMAGKIRGELDKLGGNEVSANDRLNFMLFMGSAKEDIVKALKKVPIEDRFQVAQGIADIVGKNSEMVFSDQNDFAKIHFLQDILENDGVYDDWDKVIDNAFSLLDSTIILAPVARVGSFIRNARKAHVRNTTAPTSAASSAAETNPSDARAIHEIAAGDHSGEASEALYGTNRVDAVANDFLPELTTEQGILPVRTGRIDRNVTAAITPDVNVMDFVDNYNGAIHYFKDEKIRMVEKQVNDFQNATGMISRDEMFAFVETPDGVRIRGVYGMADSGYANPQEALELAKWTFRDKGITDDNLKLFQRTPEGYREVPLGVTGEGDYLVAVDYRYKFNPLDNVTIENADVKLNFFDYIPNPFSGKHGSIQRNLLDPASMLNPTLTKGAFVAVDKTFGLEKTLSDLGKTFSNEFSKLPKNRRDLISKFIYDANENGIEHSYANLRAAGMNQNEISMMGKWKEMQDTLYWLNNRDLARNLRNQGFKVLHDPKTDTRLFAKPRQKAKLKYETGGVKVYDHTTDEFKSLSQKDIDQIYESGGTLAELKQPIIDGEDIGRYIISTETPGSSFLRGINETDQILNYRKGYYQVNYKDPKFIEKIVKDKQGNIIQRVAVGSAETTHDAELFAQRMRSSLSPDEEGVEFIVRSDVKGVRTENDDAFDVFYSSGLTAQKRRGQRLQAATRPGNSPTQTNVVDPVESLTRSIRQVSRRVSMREYLDATKDRFIKQYGHLINQKDEFNRPVFPSNSSAIGLPGRKFGKDQADARTTWEYINYLENGYVNSIEDGYKAALNGLAEAVGVYNHVKPNAMAEAVEKGLRNLANTRSPDQLARSTAFKMYLALNPFRQQIVQSHQAIRLAYLNPGYVGTKLTPQLTVLAQGLRDLKFSKPILKAAGMTEAEAIKMVKDFKASGLAAAVDANNLIRGDLKKLADTTISEKVLGMINKPINLSQRIGFDFGEQVNITTAWLTFRHRALQDGKKLNAEALDNIAAEARNYTYGMNAAGDMPYNRNMFSMLFQFAQVPHKALLNNLTNRNIPFKTRMRTAGLDLFMFGTGTTGVGSIVSSMLPDDVDPTLREGIQRGFEDVFLNTVISQMTGTETDIDFSSLAPSDITGLSNLLVDMMTTDIPTIIANSPSGSLFFGGNPRITTAFRDGMSMFGIGASDDAKPAELSNAAKSFASIASGYSNAWKAAYALKYGQKINSYRVVLDENVSTPEAIAIAFGFSSHAEAMNRKVSMELYEASQDFKDDIGKMYKDYMRRMSNDGLTAKEILTTNNIFKEFWRVYGSNNPKAVEELRRLIMKDLNGGNVVLFKRLSKVMGFMSPEDTKQLILNSGLEQEHKDLLIKELEYVRNYTGDNE